MAWNQQEDDTPEAALPIPQTGDVSFHWALRLHTMALPSHVITSKNIAPIDLAREKSVEAALDSGAEWIFMLDSDVIPPRDVYPRLKQHQVDIVSGMYFAKKEDPHPAMWKVNPDGGLAPVVEWPENALIEVDTVGLGCALIHRRVFEDIERPWFRWTQGYDSHPWDTEEINGEVGIGEDFYFFHKAKEEGYNVYADTSVECKHEVGGMLDSEGYKIISQTNALED